MKKLYLIALSLVMSLGLTACGGVDTTSAVDSFNATSERMDEIGEMANPNAALLGDEFMDEMIVVAEDLLVLKNELESEDITQERADEIEAISEEYLVAMDEFEQRIEAMLEDPILVKTQAITDIVAELTDGYNETVTVAIDNGWDYDDLTASELNALAAFLEAAQTEEFYAEVATFDEVGIDALLEQCQLLQTSMADLATRVSVPYSDEK